MRQTTSSGSDSTMRSLASWAPFLVAFGIVLVAGLVILLAASQLLAKERAPIGGPTVTPMGNPSPSARLTPAEGGAGSTITVTGSGWQPGDALAVYLDSFEGEQPSPTLVAETVTGPDGTFTTSFVYSTDAHWQLPASRRLLITVSSQKTGDEAYAVFQVTGVASPTPNPSVTSVPEPSPTVTTEPPGMTPTAVECTDRAAFVTDVTVPDNTRMNPGQNFVKSWRLRNSGTCTWTTEYSLVFVRGDQMNGSPSIALPQSVAPGATLDLSVALVAPSIAGAYRGDWQLRNRDGAPFGLESSTGPTFWVKITVVSGPTPIPTATPTSTPGFSGWRAEYYANRDLNGTPLVRDDREINFSWGNGSPIAGLPADSFSVRWNRTPTFETGTYRFYAQSDDGVRVWLDGQLLINEWHDASGTVYSAERTLAAGSHTVRVEYYENLGDARVRFWWERPSDFPQWRGDYYANPTLSGSPALTRNDPTLDFDWRGGAPVGLPIDRFSARWARTLAFDEGLYRFRAVVDDGIRVYVDDRLVINEWRDGAQREVTGELRLTAGLHSIRVEYYEQSGDAVARVWWDKLASYPDWKGEYWPNRSLSGTPALVRNDVHPDFNWGRTAPAVGLPADNFGARWTRAQSFEAGTYRFHVLMDDGARLWVDDKLIIDSWQDGSVRELTADRTLASGSHSLRLDYYENAGDARIRLWWEKVAASYPDWKGEYWSNRELSGSPSLVRNDQSIDFGWGTGPAAAGLPADNWSARWSRTVTFEPGLYRFSARADDGIRFYLDGQVRINEWHDSSGGEEYTVDLAVSGTRQLTVEYYEHSSNALIKFWWQRVGSLPTSTPQPTPTPRPTVVPTATPTRVPSVTPTQVPPSATPTLRPTDKPPAPTATPTSTSIPPSPTPTSTFVPPSLTPTPTRLPPSPTATPGPGPGPGPAGARLNEIFPVPVAASSNRESIVDDEWIEIYNPGPKAFDLSGWWLDDGDQATPPYRIPRRTVLPPRSFLVFYGEVTGLELNDNGDTVSLIRPDGRLGEQVTFGQLPANASYSRDDLGVWHSDWPPSPGATNSPIAITPGMQPDPPGHGLSSIPTPK